MVKVPAAGVKRRKKPTPKPKLSDEERHERFVAMAHEVEAEESQEAFDQAFDKVTGDKKAAGRTQTAKTR